MRTVTNTAQLQAAIAEGVSIRDIAIDASVTETVEAARQDGYERGLREDQTAAIQHERSRVREIQALAPPKHEELVATAISSGMDPATFSMIVLREHKHEAPSA